MLFDLLDRWVRVHDLKPSTRKQYKTRIEGYWKHRLRNVPIDEVRYSDILEALSVGSFKSAKSRNNELCLLRGAFEMAVRDGSIAKNPCDGITGKKVQRKPPDPFSMDESELIIEHLKAHRPEPVANFIEFMFFTGLRTGEGIALKWNNVDLRKREILVEAGRSVPGDEADTTKTSQARIVLLNARAFQALQRQQAHTFLKGGNVFEDPKSGSAWKYQTVTDVRSFWAITLKRLGIRYRRPYNMRHTYATIGLMSGAKPGFLAKQLGHGLQMFFNVYATWLSSTDDQLEIAKVDAAITRKSF